MRLTHHNLANMETIEDWNKCFAEYYQRKEHLKLGVMYKKLSDLEDIEDELGIDLITLFNEEFKKIAKCYIKKEQFVYAPKELEK